MGPIQAEQKHNIFDEQLLQRMQQYYESIGTYRSSTMNKADPGEALEWVDTIIREQYPQLNKFLGGNFYRHEVPYHPHVDHLPNWPLAVNFVIPIFVQGPPVNFVVFDQRWHKNPRTWSMVQKTEEFAHNDFSMNQAEDGVPGTSNIEFHTQKDIDRGFWEKHLDHAHKCYFGLSGNAFPFERGSLIMFETKQIHCTGKFKGNKLGLTLRYSIKQEEI